MRTIFKSILIFCSVSVISTFFLSCVPIGGQVSISSQERLNRALLANDSEAYILVDRSNANIVLRGAFGDEREFRPIHNAAANNDKRLVDTLVANGADLKAQTKPHSLNRNGSTPAEIAAFNNHHSLAKYIASYTGEEIYEQEVYDKRKRIISEAGEREWRELGKAVDKVLDTMPSDPGHSLGAKCSRCGRALGAGDTSMCYHCKLGVLQ